MRVADSGLVTRHSSDDLDMDVVWRVLSNTTKVTPTSVPAVAGIYSNGVPGNGRRTSDADKFFSLSEEKFSGSYGGVSEVDDLFVNINQDPATFISAPRHTSEEMRQLHLGHLYLVFDFVDTDLSKIIRSNQYMTKGHVQFILYQLLLGLKYMHSANVIHRDIKPANILVSCVDCSVKIADFGLARVVEVDTVAKQLLASCRNSDDIPETRSNREEEAYIDCEDAERGTGDTYVPQIQSPLPDHLFPGMKTVSKIPQHSDRVMRPIKATSQASAEGGGNGCPVVPRVPLKRALTKHVVRNNRYYQC
jgi:serine/threonine protein kinase